MVIIMRDEIKPGPYGHQDDPAGNCEVEVSLKLPEGTLKKTFLFDNQEKIWLAKLQVVNELAKGVKDALNYGFYEPPCNGRSGKFLDEERTFKDYPQRTKTAELEFKYKRRVYKSMQYDAKTLQKVHTKGKLKKLLELVASNSVSQVAKLTDKGLDPNFQEDKTGETPLTIAVVGDDRGNMIMTLVNGGAHLDYRAGDGFTALHKAAIAGKVQSVKTLLDLGASPNYRDGKNLTALYCTVLYGSDPYCTEILLNDHSDRGLTDHQGMQEIHHACKNGLVQHLEHLLFYGVDINATTASGNTPLHTTAVSNQEDCARVLLFRGAKRDKLNYANQSAYEVAAVAGNNELAEFIRTFSDGQIVKISGKPTYSTRRRKPVSKPRASSLFERAPSDAQFSVRSDSASPSPGSSTNSIPSSFGDTISQDGNGLRGEGRMQRSLSLGSTTSDHPSSDSSYCSESESGAELSPNEHRSRAKEKKSRSHSSQNSGGRSAPPVKMVSGGATMKKRLYAGVPGKKFIAVKEYRPNIGGELALQKGDIVEVLYVGEKGFWEGRVNNKNGWFPHTCVEELKKDKQRPKTLFGRPPSLTSIFTKSDMMYHSSDALDRGPGFPDRVVTLNRGKAGFGFQMRGANSQTPRLNFQPTPEFPALQYIGEVEERGEADMKGVKDGDFILEVEGEDVTTATHTHVVQLIKKSGSSVTLKIVTVPIDMNAMENGHGLVYGSLRGTGRVPPPLPARAASTTLTLGRMRTNSRPSLFEAGLGFSREEPANFQVDSVIAVSKDSPWSTVQRRKPSSSNSAQFKFNGKNRAGRPPKYVITETQRSRSLQNIAAPPSYESVPGKRPVSTAVPFEIPRVPDYNNPHLARSVSEDPGMLSVKMQLSSHSTPDMESGRYGKPRSPSPLSFEPARQQYSRDLQDEPVRQHYHRDLQDDPVRQQYTRGLQDDPVRQQYTRDLQDDPVRQQYIRDPGRQQYHIDVQDYDALDDDTLVATPVNATVVAVEEHVLHDRVTVVASPVDVTNNNNTKYINDDAHGIERRHSFDSRTSTPVTLSSALEQAVAARSKRMDKKIASSAESYVWGGPSKMNERKISAPASVTARKRASTMDKVRSDIMAQLNDESYHGNGSSTIERTNNNSRSDSLDRTGESYKGSSNGSSNSLTDFADGYTARARTTSSSSSSSTHSVGKPPLVPKPLAAPPKPPPAPPPIVQSPVKPVKQQVKPVKKASIPMTPVLTGLITTDALNARRGKLKSVGAETPKNSKPNVQPVGRLGSHGNKPAPTFGSQHANMLAKAVAARAARLAVKARDAETSESPSSWDDEPSDSPTIPINRSPSRAEIKEIRPIKKAPPPVPPKKKSPLPHHKPMIIRPEPETSPRRSLWPPRSIDTQSERIDTLSLSGEEDRTMMMFDDMIRREAECENWSLNSWNSSDSSSVTDVVTPPVSFLSNSDDGRMRKSSGGSNTRPWYEYSSGSPSEESLNASSERISKTSYSQEDVRGKPGIPVEPRDEIYSSKESVEPVQTGSRIELRNERQPERSSRPPVQLEPLRYDPRDERIGNHGNSNHGDSNHGYRGGVPYDTRSDIRPASYGEVKSSVYNNEPAGQRSKSERSPRVNTPTDDMSSENEDEVVEKYITTSTGLKIKLMLKKDRSGSSTPERSPAKSPSEPAFILPAVSAPVHEPPASPPKPTTPPKPAFKPMVSEKPAFKPSVAEKPAFKPVVSEKLAFKPMVSAKPAKIQPMVSPPPLETDIDSVVNSRPPIDTVYPPFNHEVEECFDLPPPPDAFTDALAYSRIPSPSLPPPPDFTTGEDDSFDALPAPTHFGDFEDERNPPPPEFTENKAIGAPLELRSSSNSEPFVVKPLPEWSCDDVCQWLESINLGQYIETFRDNDIQGCHLPELTKAELRELGVKSLGHRMTMENSVAKLCHPLESSC